MTSQTSGRVSRTHRSPAPPTAPRGGADGRGSRSAGPAALRERPVARAEFDALAHMPPGHDRDELCCSVINRYLPMADRLAHRYLRRGEPAEDLEQVARLGLVKAVRHYDPARGPFEPYAVPTVLGEVKRHFRDHGWAVRVPRRQQELRNTLHAARHEMEQELEGQEPTELELAERTGLDPEEVRRGLAARDVYSAASLDAPSPGTDELSLGEAMGAQDPALELTVDREALKPLIADLPERERRILFLRFFRDLSQREIGDQLGISQMHVSRLLARTCADLRAGLLDDRPVADPAVDGADGRAEGRTAGGGGRPYPPAAA